jgi:hypothetical protein
MVEEDFRAEMQQIEVPTLLIHGDRDRSAPIEITGTPSARLIPRCRFLIYEGAPHGLLFTHMDRLHEDILEFVWDTPRRAANAALAPLSKPFNVAAPTKGGLAGRQLCIEPDLWQSRIS